jgi:hypothetical protein
LKRAVFEFRHSNFDDECRAFSELCAWLDWKDALPFMTAMIDLVDADGAKLIRHKCQTLEGSP